MSEECDYKKLKSFLKLEKGWDSFNGDTFTENTIKAAMKVLDAIKATGETDIFIAPCGDGSVDIEVNIK